MDGLYGLGSECVYWVDKMIGFSLLSLAFTPLNPSHWIQQSSLSLLLCHTLNLFFCVLPFSPPLFVLYSHYRFLSLCTSFVLLLSLPSFHFLSIVFIPSIFLRLNAADQSVRDMRWSKSSGLICNITCFSLEIAPNSQNALCKAAENIRSECATGVDHYLKLQHIMLPICTFIQL